MEKRTEKTLDPDLSSGSADSIAQLSDIPEIAFNATNQLISLSNIETQEYIDVNQAFLDTRATKRRR
ncbi:MAG: hypothetical protein MZV63_20195 [Marinilabiliales bacterium]|nr:hypothetical protein [Marinilabiliales bacterium]